MGRPGVLLVAGEGTLRRALLGSMSGPLGVRGIVILALGSRSDLTDGLAFLGSSAETRGAPLGAVLWRPSPSLVRSLLDEPRIVAIAVFDLVGPLAPPDPERLSHRSSRLLVLNVDGTLSPSSEATAGLARLLGVVPIEKWYRGTGAELPDLAFRDAAEWLAERLAAERGRLVDGPAVSTP